MHNSHKRKHGASTHGFYQTQRMVQHVESYGWPGSKYHIQEHINITKVTHTLMDGQRASQTMEGRDQQQNQHHHGMHHHPMHPQPAIYGYPVDPSWGGHGMMHPHHYASQGYPHPMHHHMDGVPLPPGIPGLGGSTDPLEAVLGPFPCARLRNLPFDVALEDILVLFQGLVVIDVVLIEGGETFVIFANPMDYQMALQRDRQTIGRTFVEIYQGSRSEYYSAVASQQWQEQQRGAQMPLGEGEGQGQQGVDPAAAWGNVGMPPPIQALSHQHYPGDAGQRRAAPMSGAMQAGRGTPAGRGGMAGGPPGAKRAGGGIQVGEHTGFLRMRGLPFTATKEEIAKFFEAYNPILESIVLTYRSDGRATGEAYIGFDTPENSSNAMDLHRKSMGTRYIELFLSNKEEHGRALTRFSGK